MRPRTNVASVPPTGASRGPVSGTVIGGVLGAYVLTSLDAAVVSKLLAWVDAIDQTLTDLTGAAIFLLLVTLLL